MAIIFEHNHHNYEMLLKRVIIAYVKSQIISRVYMYATLQGPHYSVKQNMVMQICVYNGS